MIDDEDVVDGGDTARGLEALVEAARRQPAEPEGARDRVMARVREEHARTARHPRRLRPGPIAMAWGWLTDPRTVRLSPLAGTAAAATLVVLAVLLTSLAYPRSRPDAPAAATAGRSVQFVFVAPGATSVSLVGDFNDWQARTTHLARTAPSGVWSVDVHLTPGRHVYAFLVDDVWMPDAFAPRAPDSDFGAPTSVVVVSEGGQS